MSMHADVGVHPVVLLIEHALFGSHCVNATRKTYWDML